MHWLQPLSIIVFYMASFGHSHGYTCVQDKQGHDYTGSYQFICKSITYRYCTQILESRYHSLLILASSIDINMLQL